MELKKNPKYDFSRYRVLFFNIGLILAMVMVITAFEWKFYEEGDMVNFDGNVEQMEDIIDIPLTQQPPPPPPKVQTFEIKEVSNVEEEIEDIEIELDIEISEDTKVAPIPENMDFEEAPEEEVTDEIFMIVEERPEPKDGIGAFYKYVAENMRYPAFASRSSVEGKVFVQFVVERDGSLTQVKVLKGIGYGCDEEAVRVLEKAPKWEPGKQRGNAVRVRMMIPITFKLADQ